MAVKTHLDLEVPGGAGKVLLHACCAPCSSAILECMLQHGITPVIFYSNSNIYPYEEYDHRRTECVRYAEKLGVEMVEDEYDHDAWLQAVKGLEGEPERGGRCLQCFRFRLGRAAEYARTHGYTVLTTTLASSRWKNLAQIDCAGAEVCDSVSPGDRCIPAQQGVPVTWWQQNWRKGGLQERRGEIIREMNFYNQLWCGCEFSIRNTDDKK
ncbi:MAG: epoxyqueuosine reductase QueH [Bacteroidales bacterium]|nr:epoxyqueuosine reductase QueH [Bacteroidales bacterium]